MRILRPGAKKGWGRNRSLSDLDDRQAEETKATPRCAGHRTDNTSCTLLGMCLSQSVSWTPLSFVSWPLKAGSKLKTFLPACTPSRRPSWELSPESDLKAGQMDLHGADSLVSNSACQHLQIQLTSAGSRQCWPGTGGKRSFIPKR